MTLLLVLLVSVASGLVPGIIEGENGTRALDLCYIQIEWRIVYVYFIHQQRQHKAHMCPAITQSADTQRKRIYTYNNSY